MHTYTHADKKKPNTIDIIDKRAVVVLVEIIVIEEGRSYYCSKHKNRYTLYGIHICILYIGYKKMLTNELLYCSFFV